MWVARGPKDRKKSDTGEGFEGQRLVRVGQRVISAEVIEGLDENGWVHLLVRSCEVGTLRIHRRELIPVKAGTEIKRA